MRRRSIRLLPFALCVLATITLCPPLPAEDPPAHAGPSAAEIVQSVYGNRLRDGGTWRQDNDAFEAGSDAPEYWLQVWRNGPGGEVVILDAYAVTADDRCSALVHVVFTHDRESDRIRTHGFGANGLSGHGTVEHEGTLTTTETTVRLPGGDEVRLRDREDQGASEAVVVHSERWNGERWVPGRTVTWRRSTEGLPCADRAGGPP